MPSDSTITARTIKKELKSAFPSTKFSVRNGRGGYSTAIYVRWTDGPSTAMVEFYTEKYVCSAFDAYADMTYSVPIDTEALGCQGADYVFADQEMTDDFRKAAAAFYESHTGTKIHDLHSWDGPDYMKYYYAHVEEWAPPELVATKKAMEQAAEEHRKASEEETERKYQEYMAAQEKLKAEGRQFVDSVTRYYPVEKGAPYVVLTYTSMDALTPLFSHGDTYQVSADAFREIRVKCDKEKWEGTLEYSAYDGMGNLQYSSTSYFDGSGNGWRELSDSPTPPVEKSPEKDGEIPQKNGGTPPTPHFHKPDGQPVNPEQPPRYAVDFSHMTVEEFSKLMAAACMQDLFSPIPPDVMGKLRKHPLYKKCHIAAVLHKAFTKKP